MCDASDDYAGCPTALLTQINGIKNDISLDKTYFAEQEAERLERKYIFLYHKAVLADKLVYYNNNIATINNSKILSDLYTQLNKDGIILSAAEVTELESLVDKYLLDIWQIFTDQNLL